jgi:hypothetical protein
MRRVILGLSVLIFLAGCGGPPPPEPLEPEPDFVLEGTIYDDREQPAAGITVYLFPIGEAEPAGFTRSDASGSYRIEIDQNPPERMLLIFNSNRHEYHDSRFLPHQDRVELPGEGNTVHRLYYLAPVDEAPPSRGNVFVIKDLCNVRAAPNTDAPVVAQVTKGQSLDFLERDGDWFWVETKEGTRGWIYRMLVTTLDHRLPE